MSEALIEALLREREGYRRRNLPGRVRAVEAQLARLGHRVETAAARPVETTADAAPENTAAERPAPAGQLRHVGRGTYELPDGSRVRGREQALAALAGEQSDDDGEELEDEG